MFLLRQRALRYDFIFFRLKKQQTEIFYVNSVSLVLWNDKTVISRNDMVRWPNHSEYATAADVV